VAVFRRAIELDPERADSHCNLRKHIVEFRRLPRRWPVFAGHWRYGLIMPWPIWAWSGAAHAGSCREAEASCQSVLAIDPASAAAISLLGELRADHGQFSEAEELFKRAIAIDPAFAFGVFQHRDQSKNDSHDTAWLEGTEALLAMSLPLRHEMSLRYALGKYFDDVKQYDQAFSSYRQANELTKRYGSRYDRSGLTERVDRTIKSFDAEQIRRYQSRGNASDRPVFIVACQGQEPH